VRESTVHGATAAHRIERLVQRGAHATIELGPAIPGDRGLDRAADRADPGGGLAAGDERFAPGADGASTSGGLPGAGEQDVGVIDQTTAVPGNRDRLPDGQSTSRSGLSR
jgi:hypothetical protein